MRRNESEKIPRETVNVLSYILSSSNNGLFNSNSELIQYAKEKANREIKQQKTKKNDEGV
jgi:hypothetical protein